MVAARTIHAWIRFVFFATTPLHAKAKASKRKTGSTNKQSTGMDIYEVLGLLNSDLYTYLHFKLFGGVNKIARENLMALPLPSLSPENHKKLRALVQEVIRTKDDRPLQDFVNLEIFDLTKEEVIYMESIFK